MAAASPELSQVVEALDGTGWAIEVLDADWNISWASKEMRLILGAEQGADLGMGRHVCTSRRLSAFEGIGEDSSEVWLRTHVPWMLHDGAVAAELSELVHERHRDMVAAITPQPPPLR